MNMTQKFCLILPTDVSYTDWHGFLRKVKQSSQYTWSEEVRVELCFLV